jgi:hypothetical protein
MTTKDLSLKQACWAKELACFNFEVKYKPRVKNAADSPLRRLDYSKGLKLGEQQVIQDAMLPTLQNKL